MACETPRDRFGNSAKRERRAPLPRINIPADRDKVRLLCLRWDVDRGRWVDRRKEYMRATGMGLPTPGPHFARQFKRFRQRKACYEHCIIGAMCNRKPRIPDAPCKDCPMPDMF